MSGPRKQAMDKIRIRFKSQGEINSFGGIAWKRTQNTITEQGKQTASKVNKQFDLHC